MSGSGRAGAHGRVPGAGPPTRTRPRRSWPPSTAAGTACADRRPRRITAMKARELGRGSVVVGDTVSLAGDPPASRARWPGRPGRSRARSVLRRSADDTDPVERVIVANAEQLVIVDRAGGPAAAAAADRPLPGRRLRRRAGAAAVPDQGRPGRPRARSWPPTRPLGVRVPGHRAGR